MTKSEITLFTSLPTRLKRPVQGRDLGPAWQTACINSWKDAGFRVVSLNNSEEIAALRFYAPTIEFMEIPSDLSRPRLTDFFDAAKSSGSEIVGIINADCMIVPNVELASHLPRLHNSVVIIERINLSQETLRPTGLRCTGFDAFFFDVAALAQIQNDDHWHIGNVWIDYWLPFAFHRAGVAVKTLPSPLLFHLDHELAWDWGAWASEGDRVIRLLKADVSGRLDPALATKVSKLKQTQDAGLLQNLLFDWLKSQKPLWEPEIGSVDDLATRILNASAVFPQPGSYYLHHRLSALSRRIRSVFRRVIDTLGLRNALFAVGLVKRRHTSS